MQVSLSHAQGGDLPNYADVVVDLGRGDLIIRRVNFITPTISGLEALRLTGLDLEVAEFDFGAAVCGIEDTGCPADNCFCGGDSFWGYHYLEGDSWQAYQVGATDTSVSAGAVEGWLWGPFGQAPRPVTRELLAAQAGLQWLRAWQETDGPGAADTGAVLDTILALAAADGDPADWRSSQEVSLLDQVRSQAAAFAGRAESRASIGKLALAVAAMGRDPRAFAGMDLLAQLESLYDPASGAFGTSHWDQALSMLGWRAAGEAVPALAVQRLAASANADGGWGWNAQVESDVDTSALAVQALVAAGQPLTATSVVSGLAYLQEAQNPDGGFPYTPVSPTDTRSNTNSTAFVVQALLAANQDPLGPSWTIGNNNPVSYLLGQQDPQGGFAYIDPPADGFATRQAIPALLGSSLDLRSSAVALRKAADWMAAQQQADGSFAGFNPGATIDAVLAMAAAGRDPLSFAGDQGQTALDFLVSQAPAYVSQGASAAGKLAVGVAAAGGDPRAVGGLDLAESLEGYVDDTGRFGAGTTWDQAWGLLGLAAARRPLPAEAVEVLAGLQREDGGWGFDAQSQADADSTALALQALVAAGRGSESPALAAGRQYLRSQQRPDGGLPGFDGATSAGSTGLALQALAALGMEPGDLAWAASGNGNSRLLRFGPKDALLRLQSPQGGFPGFSGADDPLSTYQAVPGIAGAPFVTLALEGGTLRARRAMARLQLLVDPLCRSAAVLQEPFDTLASLCQEGISR